jgi:hypothetical protein
MYFQYFECNFAFKRDVYISPPFFFRTTGPLDAPSIMNLVLLIPYHYTQPRILTTSIPIFLLQSRDVEYHGVSFIYGSCNLWERTISWPSNGFEKHDTQIVRETSDKVSGTPVEAPWPSVLGSRQHFAKPVAEGSLIGQKPALPSPTHKSPFDRNTCRGSEP